MFLGVLKETKHAWTSNLAYDGMNEVRLPGLHGGVGPGLTACISGIDELR